MPMEFWENGSNFEAQVELIRADDSIITSIFCTIEDCYIVPYGVSDATLASGNFTNFDSVNFLSCFSFQQLFICCHSYRLPFFVVGGYYCSEERY